MHEMALSQSLVELIEGQRQAHDFATVRRIRVTLGAFANVEPEALRFGFEVASRGTVAENAELLLDLAPARAWCVPCGDSVTLSRQGDGCPRCGRHQLMAESGDELRLTEMEIA
jgi:hydrogenase nickel incorporation protein HypA/HybF